MFSGIFGMFKISLNEATQSPIALIIEPLKHQIFTIFIGYSDFEVAIDGLMEKESTSGLIRSLNQMWRVLLIWCWWLNDFIWIGHFSSWDRTIVQQVDEKLLPLTEIATGVA